MLISNSMQKIIRVLVNKEELTLRELAKESNTSLGMAVKLTEELKKTGYINKKAKIKLKDKEKLLKAWAYTTSISELEKIEFIGAERVQYLSKQIIRIATKNKLDFALTLFSATEIIMPYVTPDKVHAYILKKDKEKWDKILPKENMFPAEKGNIVCLLVEKEYLYNSKNNVVSLPQLYVDLFSYGGRGVEAAEELLKVMRNV